MCLESESESSLSEYSILHWKLQFCYYHPSLIVLELPAFVSSWDLSWRDLSEPVTCFHLIDFAGNDDVGRLTPSKYRADSTRFGQRKLGRRRRFRGEIVVKVRFAVSFGEHPWRGLALRPLVRLSSPNCLFPRGKKTITIARRRGRTRSILSATTRGDSVGASRACLESRTHRFPNCLFRN